MGSAHQSRELQPFLRAAGAEALAALVSADVVRSAAASSPETPASSSSASSLPAPEGILEAVLDTDTYNEIDDQFALTHALLSPERIDLQAVYAAPIHNYRSESPADGMRRSYDEIERVFDRLQIDPAGRIYRGADHYLPDTRTPVECDAVADLIARAKAPRTGPLYVLAIAAPTNVAAALIAAPEIAQRIVVVWLGGQPLDWTLPA